VQCEAQVLFLCKAYIHTASEKKYLQPAYRQAGEAVYNVRKF